MPFKWICYFSLMVLIISCSGQTTDSQKASPSESEIKHKFDQATLAKLDSIRNNPVALRQNQLLQQSRKFARVMSVQLGLSPNQQKKIVKIRLDFLKERESINNKFEQGSPERKKAFNLLMLKVKEKVSAVLDHEQRQKWNRSKKGQEVTLEE